MNVAFIHDWLDTYRGGEKVLEALIELYPDAPIFTMFYRGGQLPASITSRTIIRPRRYQPFSKRRKLLLPLYPSIIESFDLSQFDLLISSSSCAAKGARPAKDGKHLCYIHSPMRYVWDQQQYYFQGMLQLPVIKQLAHAEAARLRRWDTSSAARVHKFVANSRFVAERVKKYYDRESSVVHPPIEARFFEASLPNKRDDYFLAAGALVPYKRFDLAIAACKAAGKRLIIAGSGPDEEKLKRMLGPQMRLIREPSDNQMMELMANAQALLFPGVEDFGMIPVEAMALGTPVIALGRGGALDYTKPSHTGVLVNSSQVDEWSQTLARFDGGLFDGQTLRQFATQFGKPAFLDKMRTQIDTLLRG